MRAKISVLVFLSLFQCLTAFSAVPLPVIKTNIEDGQEIVPGDIVLFDASESVDAKLVEWAVEPQKFADGRPTSMVYDGGKKLQLACRAGMTYSLILAVANDEKIVLMRRSVTIGKPLVNPNPPGPVVPPQPITPKFPDEEFGMSTKAYQAALQQPKKDRVKALAQAFRQIGGAAVAGGFDGIKSLELASVEANRKAICGTVDPSSPEGMAIRTEWLPFFKAIQPGITEAVKGSASTPTGYGKLLIEIAVGLEAVK